MNGRKINTAWFRERLAAKQKSARQVAIAMGLDPAAMSLMLRGKRRMSLEEAEKLAAEIGSPLNDVLEKAGVDVEAGAEHKATVKGWIDSDGVLTMKRPAEAPWRVPAPIGVPDDAAAIRFQTEGATRGWLAFYQPSIDVHADAEGKLCVVQVAGKPEWHLRVVIRGYQKGTHTLIDLLGRAPNVDARLAWAAPVLWLKTSI